MERGWLGPGVPKCDSNSYGCVIPEKHASGRRGRKVSIALSPQPWASTDITSAHDGSQQLLHDCDGKACIFTRLTEASEDISPPSGRDSSPVKEKQS